ncbi:unnamed protein product [Symbiodinium sp. KB8]|nr:unnamed protein product [Symbiodinium sp. KB8]
MPLSEPDAKERSAACRVRVHDLMSSGDRDTFCTEVLVQMTDMEACSLGNGGNGGEVTIAGRGLRDFAKATDAIAKDLAHMGLLDGSALLELHFGDQGGSVLCCMAAGCDGTARPMQDFSAVFMVSTRESSSSGAAPGAAPATAPATAAEPAATAASARRAQRQGGAKRRALEAAPSDFGAFPEPNSQAPRSEASARAPEKLPSTQVTQSESVRDAARPLLQLFTQQQKSELLASQAWHAPKSPKPEVAATCPSTPVSREPHKTEQTAEAAPVPPTPNRNYQETLPETFSGNPADWEEWAWNFKVTLDTGDVDAEQTANQVFFSRSYEEHVNFDTAVGLQVRSGNFRAGVGGYSRTPSLAPMDIGALAAALWKGKGKTGDWTYFGESDDWPEWTEWVINAVAEHFNDNSWDQTWDDARWPWVETLTQKPREEVSSSTATLLVSAVTVEDKYRQDHSSSSSKDHFFIIKQVRDRSGQAKGTPEFGNGKGEKGGVRVPEGQGKAAAGKGVDGGSGKGKGTSVQA